MQTIHYVALICASLAASLPSLEAAFPPAAAPYLKAATAVLVLITGVLGPLSPAALKKDGAS